MQALAAGAHRGQGAYAHHAGEPGKVYFNACGPRLVHHIAGQYHGQAHFAQLGREQQAALQNARIHHIYDGLHRSTEQHVAGHHLFLRIGGEGVGARQVHKHQLLPLMAYDALFFFNGDAAVVAHMLASAGESVENRGFAAVGIARNGEPQSIGKAANIGACAGC